MQEHEEPFSDQLVTTLVNDLFHLACRLMIEFSLHCRYAQFEQRCVHYRVVCVSYALLLI